MRSLENENDPRILRELLKLAQSHIKYQDDLIKQINLENEKVKQQKFSVDESLLILKKRFFGKSSEKSKKDETADMFDRLRSADESDLTLHSQNIVPAPSKKMTKKLAEEIIYSELTNEELKSASAELKLENPSSDQWEEVEGLFDESTLVTVIERQFVRKVIRRQKYKLKKEFKV